MLQLPATDQSLRHSWNSLIKCKQVFTFFTTLLCLLGKTSLLLILILFHTLLKLHLLETGVRMIINNKIGSRKIWLRVAK